MNLREKHDRETRAALLKAARVLFAKAGFAAVGIREIAERAGCSTGAVFHKWDGKEDLFAEAIGRAWPDPAAFARFVLACSTLEEASQGAAIFLGDVAGANLAGESWSPAGDPRFAVVHGGSEDTGFIVTASRALRVLVDPEAAEPIAHIIHDAVMPEEPWEDCPGMHGDHTALAKRILAHIAKRIGAE